MSRFVTRLRESFDSFRDYTAGAGSRDFQRMFRRDAPEAYAVLTRSQDRVPEDATGLRANFRRLRIFLLGLSYTLSPPRRILFGLALFLALFDACVLDFSVNDGIQRFGVDISLATFAVVALVFLLALELVDRVRVRDELEVARDLQRQLLPAAGPELPGWRFAASYRTANEIGGDYSDFPSLPDGRLVLAAADASGHGMAAGLLMVIAHTTLRLAAEQDPRPEAAVALLNKALCATGGPRAFLTLFYGVLDPATGRLDFVCAGHPFPLLRRRNGTVEELGTGSLPLGLRRDLELRQESTTLDPGDLLLVYSDGLPEGVKPATGEAFGFERMGQLLATSGDAQQIHDRIVSAFDAFLAGEAQQDDISLVVVERVEG
jgi:serine phosphatase RsbU (regulator of sigma subunit)